MFYRSYTNSEFFDYLNRYLKGIILLKEKLTKVHVSYELSEAFSNHACRFSIEVDFNDFDSLKKEEKQVADKQFHNMSNNTGSKFVSFSYKPQRSYWADFEEIKSFIVHYECAKELFEGVVKSILPSECILEITPLEEEPLFIYTDSFLGHLKYSREEREFDKEYKIINGRSFDFDCSYHTRLVEMANRYSKIENDNAVSDKELYDIKGCFPEDLRRFILNKEVPFNIDGYRYAIDIIRIDANVLKEEMKNYIPEYSFAHIDPLKIKSFLEQKEEEKQRRDSLIQQLEKQSGIHIGDYVFVEQDSWENECADLGLVKAIKLNYSNQLEINYNVLKNDLLESKLPLKATIIERISYSIHSSKIDQAMQNSIIKQKFQMIRLLKETGNPNPFYKKSKKTRKK